MMLGVRVWDQKVLLNIFSSLVFALNRQIDDG